MRTVTLCYAGAAAMLVTACQGGDEPDTAREKTDNAAIISPEAGLPDAGMSTLAPEQTSMPGRDFVDKVSASDLYEVEAGKIAVEKSNSDQIKRFANMMIEDHGKAGPRLKTVVSAAGDAGLRFDPKLDADQRSQLDTLRKIETDFDNVYVRQQRAAHEKALALLNAYATNGDVQPLREHARKTADVVAGHLKQANDLPLS